MTTLQLPIYPTLPIDGGGRTKNDYPNQIQRHNIVNQEDAYFYINIEMAVCIHGVWNRKKNDMTPTSLIVFDCNVISRDGQFRLRKMRMEVDFVNVTRHPAGTDSQDAVPNMTIVARGPQDLSQFNKTQVLKKSERGWEGGIEVGEIIKPSIGIHQLNSKEREVQYSGKVESGVRLASGVSGHRYTKVWWMFTENSDSSAGVYPRFRVAILLKRETDEPFGANFAITKFDAGWYHRQAEMWKNFFGAKRGSEKDDVIDIINFNPAISSSTKPWLQDVEANQFGDLETATGIDDKNGRIWGIYP